MTARAATGRLRSPAICAEALLGILAALIVLAPARAQEAGLHNSSKVFADPADVTPEDWSNVEEMDRSWRAALVHVPTGPGTSRKTSASALEAETGTNGKTFPVIIYLHGCSGFWPGTYKRVARLADLGFLVIAPASLARKKYPRSCTVKSRQAGLYRWSLTMRRFDAGYAIEKARQLPAADPTSIFLMGFSEGAMAAATFEAQNERQKVRARIVEGWTCHTPWVGHRGIKAPQDEPLLSLVAELDPWFQGYWVKGDCGTFMSKKNGSRSIVYRDEPLAAAHGLLEFPAVQQEILTFLNTYLEVPLPLPVPVSAPVAD